MFIPLEDLPEESKVWIYQSNRKFSDEEIADIERDLKSFIENWNAHGTALEASYQIRYNRFLILAVNQDIQAASGCSIDSSVAFIQSLEKKYDVELLDKMNVTCNNGEHIAHKPLSEFKKMAKEKAVSGNTIVFNNLVNTLGEYVEYWEVPANDSWHSRFF